METVFQLHSFHVFHIILTYIFSSFYNLYLSIEKFFFGSRYGIKLFKIFKKEEDMGWFSFKIFK